MDQEGASPHNRYLHGDTSTPPYLSSPSHPLPYGGEPYSSLGQGHPHPPPSEISDGSSTHGYPDFPPSPDSWLGEAPHRY
ncbi:LIM/homeobox protein Lhx3-like [Homalodisca vitripennis]|nr:LIM/homeobox protein Lhx3-like [Homalodisca vitripennis]